MELEELLKLVQTNVIIYQRYNNLWDMRRTDHRFYEELKELEPNTYKRLEYENMYETNKRLI